MNRSQITPDTPITLTIEELATAIAAALREVKVYVVESEITEAQNSVRAVVEQANLG